MSTHAVSQRMVISDRERKAALESFIFQQTSTGATLVTRTDHAAVVSTGHRPNHLLHLFLSVLTGGGWALFVWLPITLFGGRKQYVLTVDDQGRPQKDKA